LPAPLIGPLEGTPPVIANGFAFNAFLIEGATGPEGIFILDDAGKLILNMDPYKIAENFEDEEEFLNYGDEFQSINGYDVSGYFIK
jgi:hypothetical protein